MFVLEVVDILVVVSDESIIIDIPVEADEVFPDMSVCFAVIVYVPSAMLEIEMSHTPLLSAVPVPTDVPFANISIEELTSDVPFTVNEEPFTMIEVIFGGLTVVSAAATTL